MVDILSTGNFVMDPSFKRWEVLRIVMPYAAPARTSGGDNTLTLALIAGGAFVLMAALVCGGMLCIRGRCGFAATGFPDRRFCPTGELGYSGVRGAVGLGHMFTV